MPVCFSVLNLRGYDNKFNTVLYREPIYTKKNSESKYVIFFPGDYSNFFTNSIYTSFKTNKEYECTTYCYSYEALFWIVSTKYLNDHLIFIKPSIFDNYFVHFNNFVHEKDILDEDTLSINNLQHPQDNSEIEKKAVDHLLGLLLSLKENLKIKQEERQQERQQEKQEETEQFTKTSITESNRNVIHDINEDNCKVVLIGFSKGCSVLIALLNEANDKHFAFWKNVNSILFLDPGFNKINFHFSINEESLKKISEYKLKIIVHSTLRQIYDEQNMCIHKRMYDFLTMLKKWNIFVSSYLHYDYVKKSIISISFHFEILTDFFEDISNSSYYVFLLNVEHTKDDKKQILLENKKNLKHKEHFVFENWRKCCIFD